MDKYRRQSTQTDSGPREVIQLHESAIPSGKRTCKKSIISFKLQHILFREKHRGLEILMRSRTTCCCSLSRLASGRECMISNNVSAACNTPGNWITCSFDRKWTRFFLKLKNLGILFLGSVLWARAVKKGGARPPLGAILSPQNLSAVTAPIFASEYAFCNISRCHGPAGEGSYRI